MKEHSMDVYGKVVVRAEDEHKALSKFGYVLGCIDEVSDCVKDIGIVKFGYNYTTLQEGGYYA